MIDGEELIDSKTIPQDIKEFLVLIHRGEVPYPDIDKVRAVIHEVCPSTIPMSEHYDMSNIMGEKR